LRAAGLVTAVLTNGTDTIAAEAEQMRLHDHFDAVFNSAEIGYAKPDARAFRAVLNVLQVDAHEVFFTDDSPSKVAGAEALGFRTHLYDGISGLRRTLNDAPGVTMLTM
jgi:putative hydrolase of the HAD superfamily